MTTTAGAVWRKSSRSGSGGTNCVEVADLGDAVGVRDSKDPAGTVLTFSRGAFAAFVEDLREGRFDLR